MCEVRNILNN